MLVTDLFFVSLAWWLAYLLRFHTDLFAAIKPYEFRDYLLVWPLILVIWGVVFELLDIYHPRRISTHWREFLDIFKGSCLALLVFLGLIFLLREFVLSRITVVLFWVLSVSFLNLGHVAFREGLRFLRRGGYNLRHILVIGSPIQASQLVDRLKWHRHLGLCITGVYLTEEDASSEAPGGVPVLKSQQETLDLVRSGDIDQVFITLPLGEAGKLRGIRELLGDEPIAVHFVPDLTEYSTLRGNVEEFDGLHIITLQDSPFYGWNSFLKGLMDLSLGGLALTLFFPLMALVALGIKVTSSGPVFFRQKRMGLEGREFDMFKFRTMVQDAEKTTGPIWAAPDDPRVTPFGRWLRRTSLDELPQLYNVLRGEMSLVGPRPERPPLINQLRKAIPSYMLRHKVKAGMTGWAQVNGWRGMTSLDKRIEHDIYYIENWSFLLDIKILAMSLFSGFLNKNAY